MNKHHSIGIAVGSRSCVEHPHPSRFACHLPPLGEGCNGACAQSRTVHKPLAKQKHPYFFRMHRRFIPPLPVMVYLR